jgi:hypothetical protein
MSKNYRVIRKSKYEHVSLVEEFMTKKQFWRVSVRRKRQTLIAELDDEKTAAKTADKFLISLGLEPVNILKRVEK